MRANAKELAKAVSFTPAGVLPPHSKTLARHADIMARLYVEQPNSTHHASRITVDR
jgi:hypothetical protein